MGEGRRWSGGGRAVCALSLAVLVSVLASAPAVAGGGLGAAAGGAPPAGGGTAASFPLSLDSAVALALDSSPRLKAAELALSQARTALKMAEAAADDAPEEPPEVPSIPGVPLPAVTVRDYIELARLKELGPRQARAAVAVAEAALHTAELGVRFEVEKAFYELIKAKGLLDVARLALQRGERQLDQARAFLEAGTVARTDLLAAEVAVAGLKANLVTADRLYRLAMMNLNRAMAYSLEAVWEPAEGEGEIGGLGVAAPGEGSGAEGGGTAASGAEAAEQPNLGSALALALQSRLELIQAREELECRRLDHDILSRYYASNVWERRQAAYAVQSAEASLREKELQVEFEVRSAWLSVDDARQRVALLNKAVEQAREGLRLAELRYAAGLATSLEVLSAQVSLSQAEAQVVQAACDLKVALAAFRLAAAWGVAE
ncbi:MAG: TolC family protein [Acetobacteraceae bacterium]|nr:TolC family protein [Acetobacteraceae bacterium]